MILDTPLLSLRLCENENLFVNADAFTLERCVQRGANVAPLRETCGH